MFNTKVDAVWWRVQGFDRITNERKEVWMQHDIAGKTKGIVEGGLDIDRKR